MITLATRVSSPARTRRGSTPTRFTFIKGNGAKLAGKINKRRRLSGRAESSAGMMKVTGRVKGSTATLKVTESGSFTTEDGQTFDCAGSHTFKAKRLEVSTGG